MNITEAAIDDVMVTDGYPMPFPRLAAALALSTGEERMQLLGALRTGRYARNHDGRWVRTGFAPIPPLPGEDGKADTDAAAAIAAFLARGLPALEGEDMAKLTAGAGAVATRPPVRVTRDVERHRVGLCADAATARAALERLATGHALLAALRPTDPDRKEGEGLWEEVCGELYAALRSAYAHFYLLREVDFATATDLWAAEMPSELPGYAPITRLIRYIGGRTDPPEWITTPETRLFRSASYAPGYDAIAVGLEEMLYEPPF